MSGAKVASENKIGKWLKRSVPFWALFLAERTNKALVQCTFYFLYTVWSSISKKRIAGEMNKQEVNMYIKTIFYLSNTES